MQTPQPRTLAEMRYRSTAYEIVAELPNETIRLGFLVRVNERNILKLARSHSDIILPHLNDADTSSYSADRGLQLGPVRIGKSGRTERECASLDRYTPRGAL